ncbi:MAG: amidohydrolase family protein [Desulfovibrionales bacterium]|nr:amidohydrolase family protein [Desulfovibrionales bacterium]
MNLFKPSAISYQLSAQGVATGFSLRKSSAVSAQVKIHRARWVFPVSSAPVSDGAVMVADGRIEAVGRFKDLKDTYSGGVVDHGEVSILPALVNAHTHLELAALRGRVSGKDGFVNWVRGLIKVREDIPPAETEKAITSELAAMRRRGVGLIGDVGNTRMAYELCRKQRENIVFFREFMGFNREKTARAKEMLAEAGKSHETDDAFHVAAHAPYTVSAELFSALKSWANKRGKMLSVHLGECPEEQELLAHGNGPLKDLLRERSAWDDGFVPPGKSAVAYLDKLGVLDSNTVCVHLVHLSEEDMAILAARRVKCCLCPKSNLFLNVGFPKVEKMLAYGLYPALGTDSLASNEGLSILEEMAAVRKHVPGLAPEKILEMATLNGARALGREDRLGSLTPGKEAGMISVPAGGESSREALEGIIACTTTVPVKWIQ